MEATSEQRKQHDMTRASDRAVMNNIQSADVEKCIDCDRPFQGDAPRWTRGNGSLLWCARCKERKPRDDWRLAGQVKFGEAAADPSAEDPSEAEAELEVERESSQAFLSRMDAKYAQNLEARRAQQQRSGKNGGKTARLRKTILAPIATMAMAGNDDDEEEQEMETKDADRDQLDGRRRQRTPEQRQRMREAMQRSAARRRAEREGRATVNTPEEKPATAAGKPAAKKYPVAALASVAQDLSDKPMANGRVSFLEGLVAARILKRMSPEERAELMKMVEG